MTRSLGSGWTPRALLAMTALMLASGFAVPSAIACRTKADGAAVEIVRRGRVIEIRVPEYGNRVVWRQVVDNDDPRAIREVIRDVERDVVRDVRRQRVRVIAARDDLREAVRRILDRVREIRLGFEDDVI